MVFTTALTTATTEEVLFVSGGTGLEVSALTRDAESLGLTVRVLRGSKMRTEATMFDEISAAFQFPYYFGENWPALAECIQDLEWLPTDSGYVILITDPELTLSLEPDFGASVLIRTLLQARRIWGLPVEEGEYWDRGPIPFNVVLALPIRSTWEAQIVEATNSRLVALTPSAGN
jgi:hypothetical protein